MNRKTIHRSNLLEGLETRRLMATFTVSNALNAGAGSLREAITQANATAGADLINIVVPVNASSKLSLSSPLPAITDPVTIDGTVTPGYLAGVKFEINGSAPAVGNANGLLVQAPSTIKGLSITGFKNSVFNETNGNAVRLAPGSDGSTLEWNFIGLTPLQVAAANRSGVQIESANNTLRNNTVGSGNVGGIQLAGTGATGNVIAGNRIGTDASGAAVRSIAGPGVKLTAGASNNTIGGAAADDRNIISGTFTAVQVDNNSTNVGNKIEGNYIGTNYTGMNALGNNVGIGLNGGTDTVIKNNVIAGSLFSGITFGSNQAKGTQILGNRIGMNAPGTAAMLNGEYAINISAGIDGVQIGAPGEGNWLIGGGGADKAIVNQGSTDESACKNVTYHGNVFGILPSGQLAGNTDYALTGGTNVGAITVGGSTPAHGNKFAGPTKAFIQFSDSQDNSFQHNWFGLNLDGTAGLGSTAKAVQVQDPKLVANNKFARALVLLDVDGGAETYVANNTFGLNAAGNTAISGTAYGLIGNLNETTVTENTFAGMTSAGIAISGFIDLTGNKFGTDVTGMVGITTANGVQVSNDNSRIGSTTGGGGNLFGKITGTAISLSDSSDVTIFNNVIGTNADKSVVFNPAYGIRGSAFLSPTIGGTFADAGNLIVGATVAISLSAVGGPTVIQGNTIGLPGMPNGTGISLDEMGTVTIGGDAAAAANTIAYNNGRAIVLGGGANDKVTIRRNVIHSNSGLAIDLAGDNSLTSNDALDADAGRQNFPLLLSADSTAGNATTVTGLINTSGSTPLIIDFYAADVANNEARTWLGSKTILTDNAGGATFTHTLPMVFGGKYIVATATNIAGFPNGSTSELSPSVQVVGPADNIAPAVSSSAFEFETAQKVKLVFAEDLNGSSVAANDLVMLNTTTNQPYTPSAVSYNAATRTALFSFSSVLPDGNYTFTLAGNRVTDVAGNGNTAFSGTTHVLAGDTNRDKTVNFDDLLKVAQNYGGSGKTFSQGDSNYDGIVNFDDLLKLAQNYGTSLFSAAPITSAVGKRSNVKSDLLA